MPLSLPEIVLLLVDFGMLILIWLVQTIIYPGFHRLEAKGFEDSHQAYTKAMGCIVGPLMLVQLALSALLCVRNPSPENLTLLGFVSATWALTAILSVPLHRRLEREGKDDQVIRRLVQTNWPRSVLWTLIPALRWASFL